MDGEAAAVRDTWDGVADARDRYEDELAAFTAPVRAALDRFEDHWERHVATAGPLRAITEGLPPEELAEVRETCRADCAAFATDDGYHLTGRALVASAGA